MGDSNNSPMGMLLPVDNLVRKVPHQKIAVPIVATRKSFGGFCNRLQGRIQLGVESLRYLNAPFRVPINCVGIVILGGGAEFNLNHRALPGA